MKLCISRAMIGFVLLIIPRAGARAEDQGLDIYFIDVLGGASTLVVTPERETVLIDTGWPGFDDRDPKRIEHVLKTVVGRDHLDHLVTTHWHRDHFGGVAGLAARVRIDHYWDRGLPDPNAPDHDRAAFPDGPAADDPLGIAYRKASSGKRQTLKAGDTLPLRGTTRALVLTSGAKVIDPPAGTAANPACDASLGAKPDPSDNARSLTIRFRHKAFDFLDCGDLTWDVENALVCPVDRVGPIDLFQVTHHGMAISNHPTLLKTIKPTVTVMDNGPKKGGDAATVRRLRAIPSVEAAYQLHKNAATAEADNTEPALIANKDAAGGRFIHVRVDPDGAHYSVRIGEDGPPRRFATR